MSDFKPRVDSKSLVPKLKIVKSPSPTSAWDSESEEKDAKDKSVQKDSSESNSVLGQMDFSKRETQPNGQNRYVPVQDIQGPRNQSERDSNTNSYSNSKNQSLNVEMTKDTGPFIQPS